MSAVRLLCVSGVIAITYIYIGCVFLFIAFFVYNEIYWNILDVMTSIDSTPKFLTYLCLVRFYSKRDFCTCIVHVMVQSDMYHKYY